MLDEETQNKISDAAAMLFWTHAAVHGVETTTGEIRSDGGACLLKQDTVGEILASYGFGELSENEFELVCDKIFAEVIDFAEREQSLQGTLYAEDSSTGRSPTAADVDTSALNVQPENVTGDENLEIIGELCLRHPLPAIVFTEILPKGNFMRVGSTERALGFELPLYFLRQSVTPMSEGLYALSGVFYIPAPTEEIGEQWSRVIQNSVRVFGGMGVQSNGALHRIQVSWPLVETPRRPSASQP